MTWGFLLLGCDISSCSCGTSFGQRRICKGDGDRFLWTEGWQSSVPSQNGSRTIHVQLTSILSEVVSEIVEGS